MAADHLGMASCSLGIMDVGAIADTDLLVSEKKVLCQWLLSWSNITASDELPMPKGEDELLL